MGSNLPECKKNRQKSVKKIDDLRFSLNIIGCEIVVSYNFATVGTIIT